MHRSITLRINLDDEPYEFRAMIDVRACVIVIFAEPRNERVRYSLAEILAIQDDPALLQQPQYGSRLRTRIHKYKLLPQGTYPTIPNKIIPLVLPTMKVEFLPAIAMLTLHYRGPKRQFDFHLTPAEVATIQRAGPGSVKRIGKVMLREERRERQKQPSPT